MRVRCHRNLNRGDWSISAGGRVVAHVAEIILAGVTFRVREGARQRVLARHYREVHAWAEGEPAGGLPPGLAAREVCYSPYRGPSFTTRDGDPVTACQFVHFTVDGISIAYGEVR